MTPLFRRVIVYVAVVYGLAAVNTGLSASSSDLVDTCPEVCSLSTSCEEACMGLGDPGYLTTCGDYYMGSCGNTCEETCRPWVTGTSECTETGGGSTTCENYIPIYWEGPTFQDCGDDFCAAEGGENSDTCPADCPVAPLVTESQIDNWNSTEQEYMSDYLDEMDLQGALEGTVESTALALSISCTWGFLPAEACEELPENWETGWESSPIAQALGLVGIESPDGASASGEIFSLERGWWSCGTQKATAATLGLLSAGAWGWSAKLGYTAAAFPPLAPKAGGAAMVVGIGAATLAGAAILAAALPCASS